jgi:hypothetical protein
LWKGTARLIQEKYFRDYNRKIDSFTDINLRLREKRVIVNVENFNIFPKKENHLLQLPLRKWNK